MHLHKIINEHKIVFYLSSYLILTNTLIMSNDIENGGSIGSPTPIRTNTPVYSLHGARDRKITVSDHPTSNGLYYDTVVAWPNIL